MDYQGGSGGRDDWGRDKLVQDARQVTALLMLGASDAAFNGLRGRHRMDWVGARLCYDLQRAERATIVRAWDEAARGIPEAIRQDLIADADPEVSAAAEQARGRRVGRQPGDIDLSLDEDPDTRAALLDWLDGTSDDILDGLDPGYSSNGEGAIDGALTLAERNLLPRVTAGSCLGSRDKQLRRLVRAALDTDLLELLLDGRSARVRRSVVTELVERDALDLDDICDDEFEVRLAAAHRAATRGHKLPRTFLEAMRRDVTDESPLRRQQMVHAFCIGNVATPEEHAEWVASGGPERLQRARDRAAAAVVVTEE